VSTTVRFVIVAPPTFATTIVYVTGAPTAPPPAIDFVTVKSTAGAGRTKPVDGLEPADAAAHAPAPTANAVFDTPVSTHTVPTVPVIVNVNACPIPSPAAAPVHVNRVPDATLVTTGVGYPLGSLAVALMTTPEIVSVTTKLVSVIVPVFATTIRYVTAAPVPGAAGACVFATVSVVAGAVTTTPTTFVACTAVEHALAAYTNPVFETEVEAHTTPSWPLIVNVVVVPG
jgi:hypothetical protein